jgi:phosphomannomutase
VEPVAAQGRQREPDGMLNPHIFRAYDVRGRIGDDVNPDVFRLWGAA